MPPSLPPSGPAGRRGADNFLLDPPRPRRRRADAEAEQPAPPPPRPLTRREKRNLTLGLVAALTAAGLMLTSGVSFLDFENASAASSSLAGVPAHEVFTPVELDAPRDPAAGVYLRAAELPGGVEAPPALQPLADGPTHAVNNPAPLPPTPTPWPTPLPIPVEEPPAPARVQETTAAGGHALVPTSGWISTYFGRGHAGIDIAAPDGQPIYATAGGVVRAIYDWRVSYGRHLIVDHGSGWDSLYAHLTNMAVRPGQTVVAGQLLGWVGATGNATGPHLHFELRYQGRALDPLTFLPH